MSDVDDAIRDELARLVRPADTETVMAAVAARRVVTEPKRRTSWLVAAAAIAVLGLVGLGIVSAQSEEPSITSSAGGLDVPGFLPVVVPEGAELVSVHKFAGEDWPTPVKPWATPGRYTLSYRDLTDPFGEPSFDLEVFPGVDLDVDAALAGLGDDSLIVRVGDARGVRVIDAESWSGFERIIWQVTSETVVRIDANGIPFDEVLAIAASVRSVDETAWAEALAGADIAPPYGFRGESVVLQGEGWAVTAGLYRQTFGVPSPCGIVDLDDPQDDRDPESAAPSCVNPYPVPGRSGDELLDVRHVWFAGRLLVWGVAPEGGQRVRLVYDEGTFEAAPGEDGGPLRAELIPGTDVIVFAGELTVARRPSGVEVLDAAGEVLGAYEDRTPRVLPPKPSGREPRPPVPTTAPGGRTPETVTVLETDVGGRTARLSVGHDDTVGLCLDLDVEAPPGGAALRSGGCAPFLGLSWHLTGDLQNAYGHAPAGTAYLEVQTRRRSPLRVEVAAHPDFPDVVFFLTGTESVTASDELVAFDGDGRELARAQVPRLDAGVGPTTEGG